ncbi:hypothetical protein [Actinokineospora globicatena]|uniref:Uncharacterized protein n=1 Tax=Actinokineospora globicatena TaxID=103729 RepID=A0A9W6QVI8_9PSEU|nr:hypothetical protein [Actinokineospora globicatena]MCP2301692.1 hypothetical protein [Actinokineospora globicatena]GLW76652.1 hypothetical protein Aglo01_11340 [Actinokineospora globicatena]GLW83486.1 hypothetical protein Aglo02_11260 [Actinokineospora globicatena]GLW95680.1 hypothetical protein Aglo03_64960 [Actinokineospora globicatena]
MTTSGPDPQNNPYQPLPAAPPVTGYGQQAPKPASVENAFKLWVLSGLLGLVGFVLTLLLGMDALRENAARELAKSNAAGLTVDGAVTAGLVFGGVVAVGFFALYLLFAFKMRAGRNWARMTLAILGLLGILVSVLGLVTEGAAPVDMVISVIQVLIVGGAIYFMFTAEAKPYFEQRHAG